MCNLEYKGYRGTVEYSERERLFYGKVMGVKALISYEGQTLAELEDDFRCGLDQYISDTQEGN